MSAADAVRDFLDGAGWADASLAPLAGDASTRRYARATTRDGRTAVLMDCGAPLPGVDPLSGRDRFPFTRWRQFHAGLDLRVPEVLAIDRPHGLVLLEDLGDETLQLRVARLGAEACAGLYVRASDLGRRLRDRGTPRVPPEQVDADDPLTPARLAVEMDLFLVHAAGVPLPPELAALPPLQAASHALGGATLALGEARRLLHRLCADVHAPGGRGRAPALCHRDYHARNLMVVHDERGAPDLAIIDFQDTRLGPRAYDLASLAWDPYVTLPDALIRELVAQWRPADAATDEWRQEVDLTAGQRLVKAAGTYAYMARSRGRPEYGRWLAPALDRARARLAEWPPRDALWRALGECGALARDVT